MAPTLLQRPIGTLYELKAVAGRSRCYDPPGHRKSIMTRFTEGSSRTGRSSWMRLVMGALFLTALLFIGITERASAQALGQGGGQADVVDPPARVGRLSFISGT